MVKFLHTADWQLGMTRHFLKGEAQARFNDARLNVIEQMGNIAINEGCEFVVVCGDVFESNQVERAVLRRAFERMAATPSVDFYLLPGNHDPMDASSIYTSPTFRENRPDNVKALVSSDPVEAAEGVELIGAPWPNKRPVTDLVNAACQGLEPTDSVRIVVGHGPEDSISGYAGGPGLIGLGQLEEKIKAGLIHFVALGDRHSTTDVGSTGRVWYAGAPEPTDYDEVDPGNVLVVDVDAERVRVKSRRVGVWKFESFGHRLNDDSDLEALQVWLSDLRNKDRTIVKLSLEGQLSLAQMARLEGILEYNADLLAALESWERRSDLVVAPDDVDLDQMGLSGFAQEALVDLRQMAESGDKSREAQDALELLYRLARTRE